MAKPSSKKAIPQYKLVFIDPAEERNIGHLEANCGLQERFSSFCLDVCFCGAGDAPPNCGHAKCGAAIRPLADRAQDDYG
jgi:hypothetical protein